MVYSSMSSIVFIFEVVDIAPKLAQLLSAEPYGFAGAVVGTSHGGAVVYYPLIVMLQAYGKVERYFYLFRHRIVAKRAISSRTGHGIIY